MRFHDTGIGNPDEDYWIRCMKAKSSEIYDRFVIKFRVWSEYVARLEANTGEVDLSDSDLESESIRKGYDPPCVQSTGATAEDYLQAQDVNTFRQRSHGGLEPETVAQYMEAVRNPFEDWAREFDDLFYWGL